MSDAIELLSVPEVADELRLSQTSVYRLMQSGELPHIKVGVRRYMVSREQLNTFLTDNAVERATT
jgi:excisionase family DNA binding protein